MSLKMKAYEYLNKEIILNNLKPGDPIVETEIANILSISRTPVREALKELESEGLVVSYPLRGTIVSMITPYDVEEIYNLRITLEVLALHLSINRITAEELNRIETVFLELKQNFSWEKNYVADNDLHSLLVNKSGYKRLKNFLETLNGQIERFRRIASKDETRSLKTVDEHLNIIKYLREKNVQECEESLRKHLIEVMNSTLEIARMI